MTDHQAKAISRATRLLAVDAAILEDKNVVILLNGGWAYQDAFSASGWKNGQTFIVRLSKCIGSGIAYTSLTVSLP